MVLRLVRNMVEGTDSLVSPPVRTVLRRLRVSSTLAHCLWSMRLRGFVAKLALGFADMNLDHRRTRFVASGLPLFLPARAGSHHRLFAHPSHGVAMPTCVPTLPTLPTQGGKLDLGDLPM